MRTGKLMISRGFKHAEPRVDEPRLVLVSAPAAPAGDPPEDPTKSSLVGHRAVSDRLDALERLARLRSLDMLSAEEFAAEKAIILGRSGPEQVCQFSHSRGSPQGSVANGSTVGTSLAGRLFSWKFVPIGLVAGIALSFGAQPQDTMRFFDQALRALGA